MRYTPFIVAAASCASGSPLHLADRDAVKMPPAYDEAVSPGHLGELMLKYKPFLDVRDGCYPAVALDSQGNSNPGLSPTDDNQRLCMDPTQPLGQLYTRGDLSNGQATIMYSYYFPLIHAGGSSPNHASSSSPSSTTDHTHDFQNIILTINNDTLLTTAWTHGPAGYKKTQTPPSDGTSLSRLLFTYRRNADGSHGLVPSLVQGLDLKMLAWDRLSGLAQDATRDKNRWLIAPGDKKGLIPPFADAVYQSHVDAASKADFYYSG